MSDLIYLADQKIPVIIALTEKEKANGLMHYSWPPPAMAFPFDRPLYRTFWMKNTSCPLDIIFCCGGSIIDIKKGIPFSLEQVGSNSPCDLVVELGSGSVDRLGLCHGQPVRLSYSLITLAKKYELLLSKQA